MKEPKYKVGDTVSFHENGGLLLISGSFQIRDYGNEHGPQIEVELDPKTRIIWTVPLDMWDMLSRIEPEVAQYVHTHASRCLDWHRENYRQRVAAWEEMGCYAGKDDS